MLFFLSKGYRVVAHDRRGHGRSAQVADGHDIDHYAADAFAVAKALDLKNAVHIGHSTGGGEVARYVARHGQPAGRVARAVLVAAIPPLMLYVTRTSPYARIVRAVVLEKGLAESVEIVMAATRKADSPYYEINPSGRVPYLLRDDGLGLEDSQLIVSYLDSADGKPSIIPAFDRENWSYGRLETYARSMVDGISVWVREMRRPENERSPSIQAHEARRADRLADFWEAEIGAPLMNGPLNLAQLLLISGLDFAAYGRMGDHTKGRPSLQSWAAKMRQRPSLVSTAPGLGKVGPSG